MAANAAQMRNFLKDVIGIADVVGANTGARREAVREEGLETINDLIEFDDKHLKAEFYGGGVYFII